MENVNDTSIKFMKAIDIDAKEHRQETSLKILAYFDFILSSLQKAQGHSMELRMAYPGISIDLSLLSKNALNLC